MKDIVQRICGIMGVNFREVAQEVEERQGQDSAYVISSEKVKQEFGWEPKITIDEGLRECVDWVNKNWGAIKKQPLLYGHIP